MEAKKREGRGRKLKRQGEKDRREKGKNMLATWPIGWMPRGCPALTSMRIIIGAKSKKKTQKGKT